MCGHSSRWNHRIGIARTVIDRSGSHGYSHSPAMTPVPTHCFCQRVRRRTSMETLFRRGFSRDEMKKRVARFKDLQGSDGGLPDSNMPGCERTLFNVIGFQPPQGEGDSVTSPVGGDASRAAAIPISEGFRSEERRVGKEGGTRWWA